MAPESVLTKLKGERTQVARHGRSRGTPVEVTGVAAVILATPRPGLRVRLKWIAVARAIEVGDSANEFTVRWTGGGELFSWNIGYQPLFSHATVREGAVDQTLEIVQTDGTERLLVNLDWEDILANGDPAPPGEILLETGDSLLTEIGDPLEMEEAA